jgi:tRNA threonylcarbamoyladenosine biosynthesis protein TsaB
LASDAPLVLAFDTSAAHCAAALLRGPETVALRVEPMARGQAERLLPMLDEVLAEAQLSWSGLAALAVGTGPGNFTGIRIGVAAARGLSMALGVPAIGVTLFEALAAGRRGPVLATADNRRDGICAQFLIDGEPAGPPAATLAALPPTPPGTTCIGFAAFDTAAALELGAEDGPSVASPEAIARRALTLLDRPTGPPVPLYLWPPDAAPSSEPVPVFRG